MREDIQRRLAVVLGVIAGLMLAAAVVLRLPAKAAPAALRAPAAVRSLPGESPLLDLNTAEAAELEELPGIGPVLAESILRRREESGPFRSEEDILAVPGLGEAALEKIRPYVTW